VQAAPSQLQIIGQGATNGQWRPALLARSGRAGVV
jgi:hypothetical protein